MSTLTFRSGRLAGAEIGARLPGALAAWLRAGLARHASRRDLARMDARRLADIGLTREQARREAAKPFWVR